MIDLTKHTNLYILDNKRTYTEITKFMRFLGEEYNILYLDFSYDKNKSIGEYYLTYRGISYEMAQSPKDFKEFLITNLRNIDIVIIDINGVHNIPLISEVLPIFDKVNLNILCLEKRSSKVLNTDFRFDEIYSISEDVVLTLSDDSEFTFESFKTQFIRNIKLDNLDLDL
jgi:hypothetical protein